MLIHYVLHLDAINSWQLVKEIKSNAIATDKHVAASFKHTSPAGVALGTDCTQAYIKARNCDPMSSFGDFIALSGHVTDETANVIKQYVSDGIVAPSYDKLAIDILKHKKNGKYVILQADDSYVNKQSVEYRELYGFAISQAPNNTTFDYNDFESNICVTPKQPSKNEISDLIFASICLKYGQSNNVSLAIDGQLIGMSAGQQSRIHSTRLACAKAKVWMYRQCSTVNDVFEKYLKPSLTKQDKVNTIIRVLEHFFGAKMSHIELRCVEKQFKNDTVPLLDIGEVLLSENIDNFKCVMASDAFFPFRDNIDCAATIGVTAISQPGGSNRDKDIINACNDYGISMFFHGKRMFTH